MARGNSYNAVTDLLDANIAAGRSAKAAFIDPDRTLTYGALDAATRRMANVLKDLEVRREGRVCLLMLDTVDWPVAFLGALRAGIIPVAFNTLLASAQYEYMLNDSRAEVLFVSAQLLSAVEPVLDRLPHIRHVVVTGGTSDKFAVLDDLMAGAADTFETVATSPDEVAFWLYSSGSTGDPKGVRHVHSSLMHTARHFGGEVLGMREDDVVYSAAKFFFAYGLGNALTFPMATGATTILLPGRPTPRAVFDLLHAHNPTLFFGVPTLYAAILADQTCTPQSGSDALRLCVSAGEALPRDVGEAWRAKFGVDIIDGVGSTEMLHIFLTNRPGQVRYGTSGKACPGYQVRLVNEAGEEVTGDDIGELLVAGGSSAEGYWNQRQKTQNTFEGIWTRTGDKYTRDGDGFFRYCGRTDDMFKVSGIWVSPFEVEEALISHAAVLEAAVVPCEDDEGLTKPKAFVVLNRGVDRDGLFEVLKEHVKTSIGAWKYPRWIEFVDELPKTATGKIQRFKLRS